MRHSPDDRHAAVAQALPLGGAELVVDLGGGDGGLLAALLAAKPGLRGLLYDRPHVVAGAPAVLGAAGVADRCRVEAGDFFEAVPAGGDVYVLSQVLHDWDDRRAALVLRRCHAAISPGAWLAVVERVLPELGRELEAGDPSDFLADMNMMAILGGRERTAGEFAAMLTESGFAPRGVLATRLAFCVVQGQVAIL